jgi:ABC-type transport system involved in multi-copper enzyme maturation permease subunit
VKLRGRPLNPVLARELKERLRTRRATIVVTVYLAVLALILQVVYSALSSAGVDMFSGGVVATQSARLGRSLFETLLFFMLLLVCFIVPGLTADAITGERERQTLVPLQVSLLGPVAILTGKLLSALAFVTLLVLATLPLLGVSFVLGGVSVGQMARGVAVVLATGLVVACLALACSSLARRTQAAMVLAYAATLFLVLGSVMVYGALAVLDDEPEPHRPSVAVLTLNPFFAAADATGQQSFDGSVTSPLEPMRALLAEVDRSEVMFGGGQVFGPGEVFDGEGAFGSPPDEGFATEVPPLVTTAPAPNAPVPAPPPDGFVSVAPPGPNFDGGPFGPGFGVAADRDGMPFWLWSALALGTVAVGAFVVAARRLRTPSSRLGA